ncbi:MAG TPA: STAS/SEC14 domain-containing protein [Blastocatellia bacterium]|nr:STAS/SEC14 domain-containing protein [Blastocatellia bacterium]
MEQNIESASRKQLVQAVERLSPAELDDFVDHVAALRARRHAPMLSDDESSLFAVINQALPESDRQRLAELVERRSDEMLTPGEHSELLQLQQRLEALHAARVKALAELARTRGVTLNVVMEQLGIRLPDHA